MIKKERSIGVKDNPTKLNIVVNSMPVIRTSKKSILIKYVLEDFTVNIVKQPFCKSKS